jgi:glucose/arabinose dehydrogenase
MSGKIRKNTLILISFGLLLALFGWFVFGWLYGPNPDGRTPLRFVSSYFNTQPRRYNSDNFVKAEGELNYLSLPAGFKIRVLADNLGGLKIWVPGNNWGVRQMAVKNNTIYTTLHKDGKVMALLDKGGNGIEQKTFLQNLSLPHGIEVYQDWIYIAENDKITRVKDADADGIADTERKKILDLPPFLEHWTRTVRIFEDQVKPDSSERKDFMFVSIGSSCNACHESNQWRASIIRCEVDGKDCIVYAKGLRNSVDFTEYNQKIYATDAGKDFIGNGLPPDELNLIERGDNYGWPYCYGKQVHDTTFDSLNNPCSDTKSSFVDFTAHSTPLGVVGYKGNSFPESFDSSLYVTLHGSYQQNPPSGYKVVRIDQNGWPTDFITGFLDNGMVKGRPTHIINYKNGLLISDDMMGKIYFLEYKGV